MLGRLRPRLRALTIAAAFLALAGAGAALADVTVGGDSGGSVSVGQTLTITVSDSFPGTTPSGKTLGWCNDLARSEAHGWFSVGPLGSAEGGHMQDLAVSCAPTGTYSGTWTYSGSVTVTVPADVGSSEWVSVAVQEYLPLFQASESSTCGCTYPVSYNFNHTYPVAGQPPTTTPTTTTTVAATTSPTTTIATTSPASTTTAAAATTVTTTGSPPPTTVTVAVPTTTTVATTTTVTVATTPRRARRCRLLFTAARVVHDLRAARIAAVRHTRGVYRGRFYFTTSRAGKKRTSLGTIVGTKTRGEAAADARTLRSRKLWATSYANVVVWGRPASVPRANRRPVVRALASDTLVCR